MGAAICKLLTMPLSLRAAEANAGGGGGALLCKGLSSAANLPHPLIPTRESGCGQTWDGPAAGRAVGWPHSEGGPWASG